MEWFVLDGFVTDHVNIRQGQSVLYKCLSKLEKDYNRVVAMQKKRLDIIEELQRELHPQNYKVR